MTIKQCILPPESYDLYLQFDYKQIEINALAFLSGCEPLINDLLNGVDIHSKTAASFSGNAYEHFYDKVQDGDPYYCALRTDAKRFWFLWQYGGSAKTLSAQTGHNITFAREWMKEVDKKYPQIADAHRQWNQEVIDSCVVTNKYHTNGSQVVRGYIKLPTGRMLAIDQKLSDSGTVYWPQPIIKNYPVQSFATGDIVPMMLGMLARELATKFGDRAIIVNTVHDSFLVAIRTDRNAKEDFIRFCINVLERAPQILEEVFNIEFPLPLRVDAEVGPTWADMKPVDRATL